ncbi:MAG: hypothetical protein LBG86_02165 [Puniceicoccales bacterium]|jgi:hypothetical protein|nr:hypothetical protein [Puniceicoccales bacterium]
MSNVHSSQNRQGLDVNPATLDEKLLPPTTEEVANDAAKQPPEPKTIKKESATAAQENEIEKIEAESSTTGFSEGSEEVKEIGKSSKTSHIYLDHQEAESKNRLGIMNAYTKWCTGYGITPTDLGREDWAQNFLFWASGNYRESHFNDPQGEFLSRFLATDNNLKSYLDAYVEFHSQKHAQHLVDIDAAYANWCKDCGIEPSEKGSQKWSNDYFNFSMEQMAIMYRQQNKTTPSIELFVSWYVVNHHKCLAEFNKFSAKQEMKTVLDAFHEKPSVGNARRYCETFEKYIAIFKNNLLDVGEEVTMYIMASIARIPAKDIGNPQVISHVNDSIRPFLDEIMVNSLHRSMENGKLTKYGLTITLPDGLNLAEKTNA